MERGVKGCVQRLHICLVKATANCSCDGIRGLSQYVQGPVNHRYACGANYALTVTWKQTFNQPDLTFQYFFQWILSGLTLY